MPDTATLTQTNCCVRHLFLTKIATMTSCRRGRPLPPPSGSVPTLDLHGHTKTAAIRSATAFLATTLQRHVAACPHAKAKTNTGASASTAPGALCRCPVPCHLVTGSGSHSSSQGGPVVRPAIAALLRRRAMAHHLTPRSGRGGFTVDANSGRELVYVEEGRRACTKVVVASSRDAALGREDWPDLPIHSNAGGGNFRRRHDPAACVGTDGRRAVPLSQAGQEQRKEEEGAEHQEEEEEVLDVFPLPSEVAADDSVLADIKSRSAAEAAQKRARADRERNQLQKAMEQSHDEAQKQQEREEGGEKEEREELVRALRLSREESMKLDILEEEGSASTGTSIDEMDDEEFDRLLEASRREEEEEERRRETQEREELERALQLSQQQQQAEVERNNVDNDDEEDEELLKVLALSERESRRQSLAGNENNIEEEEEEEEADLRRAMEESLAMASEDGVVGLDGIAGTGHLTDDEEAMIRQALEQSQL